MREIWVKSIGVVDGKYGVIMSNGAHLAGVRSLSVSRSYNDFGSVQIDLMTQPPKKPQKRNCKGQYA